MAEVKVTGSRDERKHALPGQLPPLNRPRLRRAGSRRGESRVKLFRTSSLIPDLPVYFAAHLSDRRVSGRPTAKSGTGRASSSLAVDRPSQVDVIAGLALLTRRFARDSDCARRADRCSPGVFQRGRQISMAPDKWQKGSAEW